MSTSVKGEKLTRKDRAGRTRARILSAAHAEFTANGYHATTMLAIAKQAEVAVQTVYFVFGTKAQLLNETLGVAVMGQTIGGRPVERPEDSEWFSAALETADGALALAHFVRGSMPIYARAAAVAESARVAAQTDSDVAAAYERADELRHVQYKRIVEALAQHGALRPELSVAKATDILATVFGPQSYLSYTVDHGWSEDELAAWLRSALVRLLIRDE